MKFLIILLSIVQMGCVSINTAHPPPLKNDKSAFFINPDEVRDRSDYSAESDLGMVASAHKEASLIGHEILKAGGNAIDAAVATSFAISVLRPQSTGIGGGGFLLAYLPGHDVQAYDFRERAPSQASRDMFVDVNGQALPFTYKGHTIANASVNGHLSVGTPGLIAGLIEAHENHGSLPLKRLIEPSIKLAREGFLVYPDLEAAIKERADILMKFEDSRRIFLPKNRPLKTGELIIQKDLAWTLEQIANFGKAGFYNGPVAEKIIAEIEEGHGILSKQDLENFHVKMRTPVVGKYRGYRIVSMPPPSSGGVHIIQMLQMLSHFDLASIPHGSTKHIHLMAEVMKRAFADRARYLGDPDFVFVPTDDILKKDRAATYVKSISFEKATRAEELARLMPTLGESPSTTHISVIDKNGIAVSSTQTINYAFGSCVVARGTGIVLNDEMDDFSVRPGLPNVYGLVGTEANAVAANKTMLSSMSPSMVFDAQGNLKLVVGSPGGPRIINATLQTIVNVIDYGMSLKDAVHSFRIHHQWLPDVINVEPHALSTENKAALESLGHELKEMRSIGDVQAIEVLRKDNKPVFVGVSDTRSNGKPY